MGLSSALDLLEEGHQVTLLEAGESPGGLAASFDFGDIRAEKFYHFICGADEIYFRWLRRLGIEDKLRWKKTGMGHYQDGRLHAFGHPISLLRFSPLSPSARLRYGFHVWSAMRSTDWKHLENVSAKEWLIAGEGEQPYRLIWEPLLRNKFGDATEQISAAWIWSRIHRLTSSRDRLFQENLGLLFGGTETFVNTLADAVRARGGDIRCRAPVEAIHLDEGRVTGLRAAGSDLPADALVSTVALPLLLKMAPGLPETYKQQALTIENIGVRCIILKLTSPFSPYFWINVNDAALPLCGLVEHTNLHSPDQFGGYSIIYSPRYLSREDPEYDRPAAEVFDETVEAMARIKPRFDRGAVADYRVFRAPYAQPVCSVGFTHDLAPLQTPVPNLVAADTTHLLPHDRSISDSLALAERLTQTLREAIAERHELVGS